MEGNNQKVFGGTCCRDNRQKLRSRKRSHPGKFSALSRQEQAQIRCSRFAVRSETRPAGPRLQRSHF